MLLPKMEGFGWYTYEISKRLVENHPDHQFFFFFDRPYDPQYVFAKNVTPVVLRPPARHPILFYIWFEWAVKKALKKYKIDLFFSPDGYLSLGSNVPQIGVIHDLNFEHNPQDLPKSALGYLKHFFPKFAQKATQIITVSEYSKNDIVQLYGTAPQKIHAIWNGASDLYRPISEEEQQTIRLKYTRGDAYFLYVGSIHPRKNLKRLVEAFVCFKKQTQSSTKLVIVGAALWSNESFSSLIPTELQQEIVFTGHLALDELTQIVGAAKLLTYIPYFEGFGIPLVEAMKCGIPLLSGNLTSLPEVAGNAAEYCNPFDVDEITHKLVELDQNTHRLSELSQLSLERASQFSWDKAAVEVARVLGL